MDSSRDLSRTDFWLGEALVCPERLTLTVDGATRRVEPRVMETLVLFAERGGATVSRDELRDALWDAHVTDDAINRAVWKARRALGPHGGLIETVSKRGYRLLAPARPVAPVQVAGQRAEGSEARGGLEVTASRRAGRGRSWRLAAAILLLASSSMFLLWLALAGDDTAAPRLGLVAADADTVPFTSMSGYESSPSISADGQMAVFANFAKEGADAFQWELWTRPLHGGEPRRITRTPEHEMNPALSPDGGTVAFVRMAEGTCGYFLLDLADGTERSVGVDCGASRGPADCCPRIVWSGDSHLLVTRRERIEAPTRIYEIEFETGARRMVSDPPAQSFGDGPMALSPAAHELALVRWRSREIADLFVLDLVSGALRQITNQGYEISGVSWSEDGRSLLFGWKRTGTVGLWEIPAAGGTAVAVATVGMNASGPAVGSGMLLYEEWKSEINLWEFDLSSATGAPVVVSTRWDWHGQRSPDARRLAFVSNRDGGAELWIVDEPGARPRRLTSLATGMASAARWAPDGRELVVALSGSRGIDIALVDAASGKARPLVQDASDDREPAFSRDGQRIYFASNRSAGWNIWSVQHDGAGLRQWTREGGVVARESYDGLSLWFVRPAAMGLWRQPLNGGDPELAVADFRPSSAEDWEVAADGIYYTRHDREYRAWLSRLDPGSGETVDLVELESAGGIAELFAGAGLWIAPDGSRAVVSSVDRSHSDLWLKRRRES